MPPEKETWWVETDAGDREDLFTVLQYVKDIWQDDPDLFEGLWLVVERLRNNGMPRGEA